MNKDQLLELLIQIRGCTFAGLDTETSAYGVRKIERDISILLFGSPYNNGYEKMVKRRLEAAGKNPLNFVLSDLPWGERHHTGLPLISHKGEDYLQTIVLRNGVVRAFIGIDTPYPIKDEGRNEIVKVRTYKLSSITAIRLLGEELK